MSFSFFNSSSTGSDFSPSSTGSAPAGLGSINPIYFGYLVATVGGLAALIMISRFTCRRVDACLLTAEQRRSREIAAGAKAGDTIRELEAQPARGSDPGDPLVTKPRSCLSKLFCARTNGKGVLSDAATSCAEGVVAALSLCQR